MPPGHPSPVDLRFPVGGLDESLPANLQPPLTTWDLLNVRGFPPSSDRLGGGSREGSTKMFPDQAGTAMERRLTGLDVLTESTAITNPGQFGQVPVSEDWSGVVDGSPANLGGLWHACATLASTNNNLLPHNNASKASGVVNLGNAGGTAQTISSAYFVDQATGVSCVVRGNQQAATATGGFNTGGPTNCGPFLAASTRLSEGIMAVLVATGSNTVVLRLIQFGTGSSESTLNSSSPATLSGSADAADYTITLTNTDGQIEATAQAVGVLDGGADLDLSVSTTTLLTGLRGGVLVRAGQTTSRPRSVVSISLTRLVPPAYTVIANLQAGAANPIDANQYFLPSAWRQAKLDGGTTTLQGPGVTSATASTSAGDATAGPWVDTSADLIQVANFNQSSGNFTSVQNWAYLDRQDGVQHGLSVRVGTATDEEDIGQPVFRVSDDAQTYLMMRSRRMSRNTSTGMVSLTNTGGGIPDMVSVVNGAATAHTTGGGASTTSVVFHQDGDVRITDDGINIRFYVNGMLMYSFATSSLPDWTPEIEAALFGNTGIGFTGAARSSSTSATSTFGSIQVVQGETPPPLSASNIKNRLAIYSPSTIQIGDTRELTIGEVSGLNLRQPRPQSASFNRKFYGVDGERAVIVDPANLTSIDWAGEVLDGVLPDAMQLVTFFRGAPYLAASDDDPTIWYKGRTLNPLDFDYGADPQVSTAVAGNNGEVGQPADAITALFAFSDDYLVFGMARSIGVLEGDPNYGGQFQIASREAGIVGPRAFCFDDRGNLYFVGAGGLYRMLRGAFDPEPVGPRKLRRRLEELDVSEHLIQMEFRASDRTVRIYATPTDGETPATCFVYDSRTDAFYADQVPLSHGPWSIEQISGVADIDRNLIIGGDDGYIRRPDDDALTDDGAAVPTYVEIPVPDPGAGGLLEYIAQELQFVLAEGGGSITWRWFTARSPEEVRTLQPGQEVASGTITGTGFKEPIGLRATGAAHKLRLETTGVEADGVTASRWALERVTALLAPTSRRR